MRDYNQPSGAEGRVEIEALSPEQAHEQAREKYQQAKAVLVETRDGRHWLSKLRWDSTETSGHHVVGGDGNNSSEETYLASKTFFDAKVGLAESFSNLSTEDKSSMRSDIQMGIEGLGKPSLSINLEQLAEIADAHHSLVHFRHQIGQVRATNEKGDVSLESANYEAIGQAWVAEQYLGEVTRGVESYVAYAFDSKSDNRARLEQVSTRLRWAHEQAVDVGDQDVELGLHELKNRLIATNDEWGKLLNGWEA